MSNSFVQGFQLHPLSPAYRLSMVLNLSELNLDGSHVIAKKGGEAVASIKVARRPKPPTSCRSPMHKDLSWPQPD